MNHSRHRFWIAIAIAIVIIIVLVLLMLFRGFSQPSQQSKILQELHANASSIMAHTIQVPGLVQSISTQNGNTVLSISVHIPNLSSIDFSTSSPQSILSKVIHVSITSSTAITGPANFEVGDVVSVTLDGSVYSGYAFNAVAISIYNSTQAAIARTTQDNTISGNVVAVLDNEILISASVPNQVTGKNLNALASSTTPLIQKIYTVLLSNQTIYANGSKNDIHVGSLVAATGSGNIYGIHLFTAHRIAIE